MYNNYDYPWGADTPDAPWNQIETPEREFNVTVSQTLSKNTTVLTDQYTEGEVYLDPGYAMETDTSEVNWNEEYHANDHYSPEQLIGHLKTFLTEQLNQGIVYKSSAFTKHLIEECEGWTEDEFEVVED